MLRLIALYGFYLFAWGGGVLPASASESAPDCNKLKRGGAQALNVTKFGAVGDGKANDTAAFQAAVNCLDGGGGIYVPSGTYLIRSDIQVKPGLKIYGDGYGSHIWLDSAAIVVSGASQKGGSAYWQLSDFRASRVGRPGPVIQMSGVDERGSNRGAIRGHTRNIYVSGSTGDGVEFSNAYLITNVNLSVRNSTGTAIRMRLGPAGLVSANSVTFVGGEIQQNGQAVSSDSAVGITFLGVAIEGNKEGVDLVNNSRSFSFYNCYFEGNREYDIRAGAGTTGAVGLVVDNGYFADGQSSKEYSILLVKAVGVEIRSSIFSGYSVAAINIPASGVAVKGWYGNLTLGAGTPASCLTSNINFTKMEGRSGLRSHQEVIRALDGANR